MFDSKLNMTQKEAVRDAVRAARLTGVRQSWQTPDGGKACAHAVCGSTGRIHWEFIVAGCVVDSGEGRVI